MDGNLYYTHTHTLCTRFLLNLGFQGSQIGSPTCRLVRSNLVSTICIKHFRTQSSVNPSIGFYDFPQLTYSYIFYKASPFLERSRISIKYTEPLKMLFILQKLSHLFIRQVLDQEGTNKVPILTLIKVLIPFTGGIPHLKNSHQKPLPIS